MVARSMLCFVLISLLTALVGTPAYSEGSPVPFTLQFTDQVFLYDNPNYLSNKVVRVFEKGSRVYWDGIAKRISYPVLLGNEENNPSLYNSQQVWFQVRTSEVAGWVKDVNWEFADNYDTTSGIGIGAQVRTNEATVLYDAPTFSAKPLIDIGVPIEFRVIDGPVVTDSYSWWKINVKEKYVGWIIDTTHNLIAVTPVPQKIGDYPICDSLARNGIIQSTRFAQTIPVNLPASEELNCIADVDLKGNGEPFVLMWSRHQDSTSITENYDILRLFSPQGSTWKQIFETADPVFPSVSEIGVYDLTGTGKPILLWNNVVDGSGVYAHATLAQYDDQMGVHIIFTSEGSGSRGSVILGIGGFADIGEEGRDSGSNCCMDGLLRTSYVWQGTRFIKVSSDRMINPTFTYGFPRDVELHTDVEK